VQGFFKVGPDNSSAPVDSRTLVVSTAVFTTKVCESTLVLRTLKKPWLRCIVQFVQLDLNCLIGQNRAQNEEMDEMSDPLSYTWEADEEVGESRMVRVAGLIIGFLLGVLFGMLGTVVHQASLSFFGLFDLPIGLILALPACALLLIGLRLLLPTRLLAIVAAAGLVGIVALFSLPSQGGSVLIPANFEGYTWTFAPTIIALIVLAWPRGSGT